MKWKIMERAVPVPPSESLILEMMRSYPFMSRAGVLRTLAEDAAKCEYWLNDIYQVEVRRSPEIDSAHLNIRRRDGQTIFRDWRHFQQIKNDIIGPECEAVELYPAESRLVDTSNKYHLYACTDPGFRFPFGFRKRDTRSALKPDIPGMIQRALEKDDRDDD